MNLGNKNIGIRNSQNIHNVYSTKFYFQENMHFKDDQAPKLLQMKNKIKVIIPQPPKEEK